MRASLLWTAALVVGLPACSAEFVGGAGDTTGTQDSGATDTDDQGGADGGVEVPETGPPTDANLSGRTWIVELAEMDVSDPPGGGPLLDSLLDEDSLIFYVSWAGDESFGLTVALGLDGEQDPCSPVQELPAADFSANPLFEIAETELVISSADQPVTVHEAHLLGIISDDATRWTWASLTAHLDTRDFAADLEANGLDACELLDGLGSQCVACDDGEELCMNLVVDEMTASAYSGVFDLDAGDC